MGSGVFTLIYIHVGYAHTNQHTDTQSTFLDVSTEARGFHEQFIPMIFTDTNPGIKKDSKPIKTIFTIKAETKDHPSHYQSSEFDINSDTLVEDKYMK